MLHTTTTRPPLRALLALLAACAGPPACAQTFTADTAVLAAPEPAARVIAQVRAQATARVLRRQGFWLEVEAGGATGWVRISALRLSSGAGLAAQETGRLGGNNIVASSAARSLLGKDILEAKSDPDALDRLNALKLPPQQLALFAQEGGLAEQRSADALDVPAAPRPRPRGAPREPGEAK